MTDNKKLTVPSLSVDAERGQSSYVLNKVIIAELSFKNN